MKILIFSDTHLYTRFIEAKYTFLKKIISEADQVIINGDFWDGYVCTFSDFINSPYKKLFPLLKSKHAIYIYGNHDAKRFADARVSLFSDVQAEKYNITLGKYTYHIEHGNHLDISLSRRDTKHFHNKETTKLRLFLFKLFKKTTEKIFPLLGRPLLRFLYKKYNEEIKLLLKDKVKANHFFVYGHTHWSEFDPTHNLIVTGIIQYGFGQYLLIDESGFQLKEDLY